MAIPTDLKLVVFDLDGTLINLPIDWNFVRQTLAVEENTKLSDYIQELVNKNQKSLLDVLSEIELDSVRPLQLDPLVIELLTSLVTKYKVAILTRNTRLLLDALLTSQILKESIYVVGREDVHRQKPDQEGIKKICDYFHIQSENALMIGDSYHDVEVANSIGAGIAIIRNKTNLYTPDGADVYIDRLQDVYSLTEGLVNL